MTGRWIIVAAMALGVAGLSFAETTPTDKQTDQMQKRIDALERYSATLQGQLRDAQKEIAALRSIPQPWNLPAKPFIAPPTSQPSFRIEPRTLAPLQVPPDWQLKGDGKLWHYVVPLNKN